jgi:hypothetical protein
LAHSPVSDVQICVKQIREPRFDFARQAPCDNNARRFGKRLEARRIHGNKKRFCETFFKPELIILMKLQLSGPIRLAEHAKFTVRLGFGAMREA